MKYNPQIIYTGIKDVFESSNNSSENKNNTIIIKNMYGNKNKNKKKEPKPKYVNKDLIKSCINALKFSKYTYNITLLNR